MSVLGDTSLLYSLSIINGKIHNADMLLKYQTHNGVLKLYETYFNPRQFLNPSASKLLAILKS
jgi:hypothetical protein